MGFLSSLKFIPNITPLQWAIAGAVPAAIFALYFLKLKRKPLVVPSTWLWKKSIEDLRVNSLWQRLRRNILLLLQLLIAAAALIALAHPILNATDEGKRWILAIDNSASMNAKDGSPTRLDDAKTKALAFVDQLGPNDHAMVLSFNDAARVICSYTNNRETVKRSIRSIPATSRRTDLTEALNIASGLANPQMGGEMGVEVFSEAIGATMMVVSDGRFAKLDKAKLGKLEIRYLSVGTQSENVAVVRLSARRLQNEPDSVEVFGSIRNFGAAAVERTAELSVNGTRVDLQRLSAGPNEDASVLCRLKLKEAAVLHVKLLEDDALPLDNEAWAVVEPPRRVKVLVVGDNDMILKTALQTKEARELAEISYAPKSLCDKDLADAPETRNVDLAIFDRCSPKGLPSCNTVFFGAVPPTLAQVAQTSHEAPAILNWNSSHAILRYLSLDDVQIVKAFVIPDQKGMDKLLETDKGCVLFTTNHGIYTDLVQTFGLLDETGRWQSDWPLKLSFPLYMLNILNSLGGAETEAKRLITPGDAITFRADDKYPEATMKSPSGASRSIKRSKLGSFEFLDTDELGVYEATTGDSTRRFAVNLFNPEESQIGPEEKISVGAEEQKSETTSFAVRRELWKWLAVAAFAILLIEWYIYNRRVHV